PATTRPQSIFSKNWRAQVLRRFKIALDCRCHESEISLLLGTPTNVGQPRLELRVGSQTRQLSEGGQEWFAEVLWARKLETRHGPKALEGLSWIVQAHLKGRQPLECSGGARRIRLAGVLKSFRHVSEPILVDSTLLAWTLQ